MEILHHCVHLCRVVGGGSEVFVWVTLSAFLNCLNQLRLGYLQTLQSYHSSQFWGGQLFFKAQYQECNLLTHNSFCFPLLLSSLKIALLCVHVHRITKMISSPPPPPSSTEWRSGKRHRGIVAILKFCRHFGIVLYTIPVWCSCCWSLPHCRADLGFKLIFFIISAYFLPGLLLGNRHTTPVCGDCDHRRSLL